VLWITSPAWLIMTRLISPILPSEVSCTKRHSTSTERYDQHPEAIQVLISNIKSIDRAVESGSTLIGNQHG
jgi:hypothetical protein